MNGLPLRFHSDGATFGQVVHRVRVGRNMTLDDLAAATGISKSSLSVIENDTCDPRLSTASKLAVGLRLPLFSLIGHDCGSKPWLTGDD